VSDAEASDETNQISARIEALVSRIHDYRLRFERDRDRRAVFAFTYESMTARLGAKLASRDNAFSDPGWVVRLAEAFVKRYADAMDAIDPGRPPDAPDPWFDVYRAISTRKSYVLEDMVFSMMAHISSDLPHSLREVGLTGEVGSHIGDYHRMNDVLASQIDEIQAEVAARYQRSLSFLDRVAGHYDEFITNYGIRLARSAAWYNASRLQEPDGAPAAENAIARSTQAFIEFVREPDEPWIRWPLRLARIIIPTRRRWPSAD
jgi:hypothetical protein